MSRYGICDTLVSDNGPQFISEVFKQFADSWQFNHISSSPYYPKGNGLAEKGVCIAKKLMKKAIDEKQSPYISFLEYRNTPLESGYSPAQLLLGRRMKSFIPITGKALLPQQVDLQKVQKLKSKPKLNKSLIMTNRPKLSNLYTLTTRFVYSLARSGNQQKLSKN